MPAARGLKRTASKAESKPTAGASKIKKKPATPVVVEELTALTKLGQVFTCGSGDVGQLGLGEDFPEKCRFTHVGTLPSDIVDICAGGMHTVAIDKSGHVWTFGCNDEGALGRDTDSGSASGSEWNPAKVVLPGKAVRVSAGDSHTAALLNTSQVFAWGSFRDIHGPMGLTLKGNERKPVEMLPGHRVVQIASGGDHLVMLTDHGQIFTCGCGEQGQLGRVTARSCDRHSRLGLNGLLIPAPLQFSKDKADFDAVWAGTHCTYARKAGKGDIFVWGLNNYQQIGVRKGAPQTVFTPVLSEAFSAANISSSWAQIVGGPHHTLALDGDGVCYVLGRKEYGRLGLGEGCDDATELTPVSSLSGKKCVQIACGLSASFAVTDDGEIYSWGMGSSGQLGTGAEDDEWLPKVLQTKQLEGRSAISVRGGGQHTVLLIASLAEHLDKIAASEKASTAPSIKSKSTKGKPESEEAEDKEDKKEVEDEDEKASEEESEEPKAKTKKTEGAADKKKGKKKDADEDEEMKDVDKKSDTDAESKMDVDETPAVQESSKDEQKEKEKEKAPAKKTAAKRGRKGSTASTDSNSKKNINKQNGGLDIAEDISEESEPKTDSKISKDSNDQSSNVPSSENREPTPTKQTENCAYEPPSKRIKMTPPEAGSATVPDTEPAVPRDSQTPADTAPPQSSAVEAALPDACPLPLQKTGDIKEARKMSNGSIGDVQAEDPVIKDNIPAVADVEMKSAAAVDTPAVTEKQSMDVVESSRTEAASSS